MAISYKILALFAPPIGYGDTAIIDISLNGNLYDVYFTLSVEDENDVRECAIAVAKTLGDGFVCIARITKA